MRAEAISDITRETRSEMKNGLPRWAEAAIAFLSLIAIAPLMVVCALATALTSGFPVIFRQQRVGQHGKNFELYKLRTMRPSSGGPQVTTGRDTRITRLGRLLRFTKLDELPTLLNVLRGDMSLVGPRPEVPRYVDWQNPVWKKVLAVRPGLTDPVTLQLRNEAKLLAGVEGDAEEYYVSKLQPDKLKGYVEYLEERNWLSDVRVLAMTLVAIVIPPKQNGLR
jgi:lipopolysaccharide/colanic/teichoic acid biosynthesis glycosyltransferase